MQADRVRLARLEQNEAIAIGDIERIASFWTDDVTLRRGLGGSTMGKEAYRALFDSPPQSERLIYVREPDLIDVSPHWPVAYESGMWSVSSGKGDTPPLATGRYSAQWVKREGRWLIRSEIFVAITCHGDACAWPALP